MAGTENKRLTISPLYSDAEELLLPVSTYLITGGSRLVVIDPGPGWHLLAHLDTISQAARGLPMVAIIQSPGPAAFTGLAGLAGLSRRRTVILHWSAAAMAGNALEDWKVQSLTTRSAGLPLSESARLAIGISPDVGPPGALMSFERSTGTLFSGPFYGSLGPGQSTGQPVLRRESVRAYADVFTPGIPPTLVSAVFGAAHAVNQIAPGRGRLAVGGSSLIQTIFAEDEDGPPVPTALCRLFVRIAAVSGTEAAAGIYRASGVAVPDLETGYRKLRAVDRAALKTDHWSRTLAAIEQWMPGAALSAVLPLAARLAARYELPLTDRAKKFATAAGTLSAAGSTELSQQGSVATGRAIGTADMPGTMTTTGGTGDGSPGDELTDRATGLMNQTVFRQRLIGQMQSETDAEGSGALILVSLDAMRRINSTYGKSGGDDALYTVAYLLRNFQAAHSRKGAHRLYRLESCHFAYVLTSGGVADGADVAERIRRSVAESAMFLEQLTVSVGVVGIDEIKTEAGEGETPERLADDSTSRAFSRMRIAQRAGANAVCSTDVAGVQSFGSGSSVLVADPDAPYLAMLKAELEGQGYTVLLARDGGEALDIISQIAPDAIVAEVMLPKKNGFSLRDELRHDASLSRIPFVLVSHRKTDETIRKASSLGITHFLSKPFSLVELVGLLRNLTSQAESGERGVP